MLRRVCLISSTLLYLAMEPATAQYNVFTYESVEYTDVIVNGQPETLQSVQSFERRCRIRATAGEWWMDKNGLVGPVGRSATYNATTCRSLTRNSGGSGGEGKCTFFPSGGSICSGPGWGTVNY